MNEIPIIDVEPLLTGTGTCRDRVAHAMGAACRGIGFFYVAGHGIPDITIAAAFAASRRFFALPATRKAAVSIANSTANRGYSGLGGETLDPKLEADLKESFNVGLDLAPDDPEIAAGVTSRGVNLWPELNGFRAVTLELFERAWQLGVELHRGFSRDLGLPERFFDPLLDRPMATLRLLHYPPQPAGSDETRRIGAGEHTDYGNITLLLTDEVGGLQVRTRAGEWLDAPVVPGAFVCNIGDLLMRWTNDDYVSTPHRVINRSGRERYSIAFFLDPNPDAEVVCLPACTARDRPARYPPIRAGEYLDQRLDATYDFRRELAAG